MSSSSRFRAEKTERGKSRKARKLSEVLRHNIASLLADQPASPPPTVKPVVDTWLNPVPEVKHSHCGRHFSPGSPQADQACKQPFPTLKHRPVSRETDNAVEAPEPAVPGSFPCEPRASLETCSPVPVEATSRSRPVSLETRSQTAAVAAPRQPRQTASSTSVAQSTPSEASSIRPPALEHTIANTLDLSTHLSTTFNGPVYLSRPPTSPLESSPINERESNPRPPPSSSLSLSWATALYQSLSALAPIPAPAIWPPVRTALPALLVGGPYRFMGGLALALAGLSLNWAQPLWTAYHAQHDVSAAASAVRSWASAAGSLVRDALTWTGVGATTAAPAATGMASPTSAAATSSAVAQTGLKLPLPACWTYVSSLAPATAAFVGSVRFFLADWGPRLPADLAELVAELPAQVGLTAVADEGGGGGDLRQMTAAPKDLAAVTALDGVVSSVDAYLAAMETALERDAERAAALRRRLEGASTSVADAGAGSWLRRLPERLLERLRHGSGGGWLLFGPCPDEAGCNREGLLRTEARARIRAFQEVLHEALRERTEVRDGLVNAEVLRAQSAEPLCNTADALTQMYGAVKRRADDGGAGGGGAGLAFDLDNLAKTGRVNCDAVRLVVLDLDSSEVLEQLRTEIREIHAHLAWAAEQLEMLLAGGSWETMWYKAENLDRELATRLQKWMDVMRKYYYEAARVES